MEANEKRGRGFELGTIVNKSSEQLERELNSGPSNCKSCALTTQPRCLLLGSLLTGTSPVTIPEIMQDVFRIQLLSCF